MKKSSFLVLAVSLISLSSFIGNAVGAATSKTHPVKTYCIAQCKNSQNASCSTNCKNICGKAYSKNCQKESDKQTCLSEKCPPLAFDAVVAPTTK